MLVEKKFSYRIVEVYGVAQLIKNHFVARFVMMVLFIHLKLITLMHEKTKTNERSMKIEDQVCNSDLSIKIKNLGFKSESYFCYVNWGEARQWQLVERRNIDVNYDFVVENGYIVLPAYTSAELGLMLPTTIVHPLLNHQVGVMTVIHPKNVWFIGYGKEGLAVFPENVPDENEANARAKMLIYLAENKLMRMDNI